MRPTYLLLWFLLLAQLPTAEKNSEKDTRVKFLTQQTTAADLQGKKIKAVEVTTEAGPAQELTNILGAQGEPPVPAGRYVPQTLVIDLEGNLRMQATAYFAKAVPKGTKLTKLERRGAFTAESGKQTLRLMAFDSEVQR